MIEHVETAQINSHMCHINKTVKSSGKSRVGPSKIQVTPKDVGVHLTLKTKDR